MSVSHKKINGLIENIINESKIIKMSNSEITIDKEKFISLCQKIYLTESSTGSVSRSQMIEDIRNEIIWHAPKLISE